VVVAVIADPLTAARVSALLLLDAEAGVLGANRGLPPGAARPRWLGPGPARSGGLLDRRPTGLCSTGSCAPRRLSGRNASVSVHSTPAYARPAASTPWRGSRGRRTHRRSEHGSAVANKAADIGDGEGHQGLQCRLSLVPQRATGQVKEHILQRGPSNHQVLGFGAQRFRGRQERRDRGRDVGGEQRHGTMLVDGARHGRQGREPIVVQPGHFVEANETGGPPAARPVLRGLAEGWPRQGPGRHHRHGPVGTSRTEATTPADHSAPGPRHLDLELRLSDRSGSAAPATRSVYRSREQRCR